MNTKERIYPSKDDIDTVINNLRIQDHIRRYQLIKRYCFGTVIDAACGVGYGSYLLSNNPDIEKIYGVDIDKDAIAFAEATYKSEKVEFISKSITELKRNADVLVSIETIEHIEDKNDYIAFVKNINPTVFIVSFPNKKSTHFNEFHYHDFTLQDIVSMFPEYVVCSKIIENDVTIVVFSKVSFGIPTHLFASII